jgi:hypothetical protein
MWEGGRLPQLLWWMRPSCPLDLRLPLGGKAGQKPLDLRYCEARVESLGTGQRAVHDGVAPEDKIHTEHVNKFNKWSIHFP